MMEKNPFIKICRLCLSTDVKLITIFNKKRKSNDNLENWEQIIFLLLQIQVNPKEGLPKKICMMCSSVLQSFMNFREKALDCEAKLKQLVKQMDEVQEPIPQEYLKLDQMDPEIEYYSPYEEGDVVVIDPLSSYLSSGSESDGNDDLDSELEENQNDNENGEEENYEIEVPIEEPVEVQPDICDMELENSDMEPPDEELEVIFKVEPDHQEEEFETLNEYQEEPTAAPNLPEPSIEIEEILENCVQNVPSLQVPNEEVDVGVTDSVDEQAINDIIDIMEDDIFAVLADPHCLDAVVGDIDVTPVEVYICQICDAAFATQRLCENHEAEHDSVNPFACVYCSAFKTKSRENLIAHVKETHNQSKPFSCFHCEKRFKKRNDLRKHAVSHAGIKTFVCAICEKNFSRRNNLRHHLKIHTGERFGCSLCSKSFSTRNALLEHEDFHKNSLSFKCTLCGLLVTRKRRLIDHERICMKKNFQQISTDLEPENVMVINLDPDLAQPQFENEEVEEDNPARFSCDICLKSFSNKRVLRHHKTTHSSAKNHVCPYCERAFLRKNELDRHQISVHEQIKVHQCSICEKSFARKDKLLRHERIHRKGS